MTRRTVLVALCALAMTVVNTTAQAATKVVNLRSPRDGESVLAFAQRKGYRLVLEAHPRFADRFVTQVVKVRGNKTILKGPIWSAPADNPDARIPSGWPCLTWKIRRGGQWIFPNEAVEAVTLQRTDWIRFEVRGYNPALAQ